MSTNAKETKIEEAFSHVKQYFPEVVMVVFSLEGRWQYMSEDFVAPTFDKNIDTSILEEASDEVCETHGFPCVIYNKEFLENI